MRTVCDDGQVVGDGLPAGMSAREAEVLAAVGANLSNAQIAGRLHISVRTVESHVSSLLRKFSAADRRDGQLKIFTTELRTAPGISAWSSSDS